MNYEDSKEEQTKERIKNELKPFLDAIIHGKANLPEMDYHIFRLKWEAMGTMWSRLIGFPDDLRVETNGIARDLFAYLGFIESMGTTLVDMIVMLIIANGKNLSIKYYGKKTRNKHVKSVADLKKVTLSKKLNFLRDNGIKEIPLIIDNKLRNDIAHLNFEIDEEGIYI